MENEVFLIVLTSILEKSINFAGGPVGLKSGATSLFVLSTQTMQWFIERSFLEVDVDDLPQSRKDSYNYQRKSKIYMKRIDGTTDLDEEELMWDNF